MGSRIMMEIGLGICWECCGYLLGGEVGRRVMMMIIV